MTHSFACEQSPSITSSDRSRRPSLYAAFTVACVVRTFKHRVSCRNKRASESSQRVITRPFSCKSQCSQGAEDYDSERSISKSGTHPPSSNLPVKNYSSNFEFVTDSQKHTTLGRRGTRGCKDTCMWVTCLSMQHIWSADKTH